MCEDQEFFDSFIRDIQCCATGTLVEKIEGNQSSKQLFVILPPDGTNTFLDIVREVCFISKDNGVTWRAEA